MSPKFSNLGVGAGPRKRSTPPPPFGGPAKKPDLAVVIGVGGRPKKPTPGMSPTPEHEAAETPEYEAQEESGAKMLQEIEAAGASVGIHDPSKAREAAGAFLSALGRALSEGQESVEPAGGMGADMGEGMEQ
jgi:hypothetical protein